MTRERPYRRTPHEGWLYDPDADLPYRKQAPDGWWYIGGEKFSWWVHPPKGQGDWLDVAGTCATLTEAIEKCEQRMHPGPTEFIPSLSNKDMIEPLFDPPIKRRDFGIEVPVDQARRWYQGFEVCKNAGVHPMSYRGLLLRLQLRVPSATKLPPMLQRVADKWRFLTKEEV